MALNGRPSVRAKLKRVYAVASEHVPGGGGVYYMRVEHDDDCPAVQTQRLTDCTCDPVAHQPKAVGSAEDLLRYMREARS